jgi:hypothetical protein
MSLVYTFAALTMAQGAVREPVPVPPAPPRQSVDYDFACSMIGTDKKTFALSGSIRENPSVGRNQRQAAVRINASKIWSSEISVPTATVYDNYLGAELRLNQAVGDSFYSIKISTPDMGRGSSGVVSMTTKSLLSTSNPAEYVGAGVCTMKRATSQ